MMTGFGAGGEGDVVAGAVLHDVFVAVSLLNQSGRGGQSQTRAGNHRILSATLRISDMSVFPHHTAIMRVRMNGTATGPWSKGGHLVLSLQ